MPNYLVPPPHAFVLTQDNKVFSGYEMSDEAGNKKIIINLLFDGDEYEVEVKQGAFNTLYIELPNGELMFLVLATKYMIPQLLERASAILHGERMAAKSVAISEAPGGAAASEIVMEGKPIKEYVLFCHGEITNKPEDLRYRMKTSLDSISFYATHLYFLHNLINDSDVTIQKISHVFEYPHEVIESRAGEIYVPPVLFSGESKEPYTFKEIIGLYRYRVGTTVTPEDMIPINDEYFGYNGPCNNDYLITSTSGYNYSKTYSRFSMAIEQDIERVAQAEGRSRDDYSVHLRIYCCRRYTESEECEKSKDPYDVFISGKSRFAEYNVISCRLPPKPISFRLAFEPKKYRRFTGSPSNLMLFRFAPLTEARINELHLAWASPIGTLLNILYQGCGLNVLAFFRYLPRMDMQSRVATLYKCGTSIHNFIDYISSSSERNEFAIESKIPVSEIPSAWSDLTEGITRDTTFIPFRFKLPQALEYIRQCRETLPTVFVNMGIPFKLYRTEDNAKKGTGHFAFIHLNADPASEPRIYDPQTGIYHSWSTYPDFMKPNPEIISIDFIFRSNVAGAASNVLLPSFIMEGRAKQVIRRPDLKWGGGRSSKRRFKGGREVRSQLMQDVLTSVPESSLALSKKVIPRISYRQPTKELVVESTKESSKELAIESMKQKADKIRDMLIYNLTIPLYCSDEFNMMIPEDELDNFVTDSNKMIARSPMTSRTPSSKTRKINSLSRSKSRSKSRSRSRSKSRAGSKNKTRKIKKTRKARRRMTRRKLRMRAR